MVYDITDNINWDVKSKEHKYNNILSQLIIQFSKYWLESLRIFILSIIECQADEREGIQKINHKVESEQKDTELVEEVP